MGDTATLTTDTPTLDTTTASGQPTPSPSPQLLPTLTRTPRQTPTCFTVDTTDIPTLTGATTAILTSMANKSKSENSTLLPLHCPEEHRNTKTTSTTSWTLHLTVLYKLLHLMDGRKVSNLSNMCNPKCSFVQINK